MVAITMAAGGGRIAPRPRIVSARTARLCKNPSNARAGSEVWLMKYVPTFQEFFAGSKFDLDQLIDRIDKLELELSDGLGREIKVVFDSHTHLQR
jgi:hypothetical protein